MPFPAGLTQTLKNYHLNSYPSFTGLPQPITVGSIVHFLAALFWACLILVAFVGWGRMTGKLLRGRAMPVSVACSVGIAAVIFLGGLLNLFHAVYAAVLIAVVGIGLLFYVISRKEGPQAYRWVTFWNKLSGWAKILVAIAILLLICRVAATVRLGGFRVEDDGSAYLVFPQKMLAAHHFASDPFSDRRVISSIGGAYFLQAIVIGPTSLAHIGMADRTLGLMLMFVVLLDLGIAFGLSPQQIAVMELIAYLVPQPTFNLTYQILPISLLLSMVWIILLTVEQQENQEWRYAVLMGAVGGAILSLKSTFLPYVGAVALLPYLFLFWRKKCFHACLLPILAGICALVVAAAWMLAMKQDSGTYLFPILGHGVDYSSYGMFPSMPRFSSSRGLVRVFLQGGALLVLAAIQLISGIRDNKAKLSLGILIGSALAIAAFNYESGGDYIWRYNFPQFFTAIIVFFVAQAAASNALDHARRPHKTYAFALLTLIGCIFYYDLEGGKVSPFREMRTDIALYRRNLGASLSGTQLVSPSIRERYRAVEAALPDGAVALDVTTDSFLLTDRNGRKFLLDDWPGAASPSPGWPFTSNSEAVMAFLTNNSIRYIVYDYDYASWFDMRSCQSLPDQAHLSELDHALEILSFATHHQFDQLRVAHKAVYDDGKIAVIDIASQTIPIRPSEPAWYLGTSDAEMCSQIVRKYIDAHPTTTDEFGARD